jgi:hypothetical protein
MASALSVPRTVLASAKRPRTFAAAAASGPNRANPLRIDATGKPKLAALFKEWLAPKAKRSLRFCLRSDRAYSGDDFASLSLSTVRATFMVAMQQMARDLRMDAAECILDYKTGLSLCKSEVSCYYLMEAVCTPAFAEAAISFLHPCGGIIPLQLGRRSPAYAMRYEGENFAAAPFVLAITPAGGEASMADEQAAAVCFAALELGFHLQPTWAVAVTASGAVSSFHGLASLEEATRFPATRSRPNVSTCYVLVPGTRRAYDLVASLYQSRNVAELCVDNLMQEVNITRLLSRLPAARRVETAPGDPSGSDAMPTVAEAVGEESDQQVAAPGAADQQAAAPGAADQQAAAPGAADQQVAAPGAADQQAAAPGTADQLVAAPGGAGQEGDEMEEEQDAPSDEEITEAAACAAEAAAGLDGFQPVRHGKASKRSGGAQPPEGKAKLLKSAGLPSKVKAAPKTGIHATLAVLSKGDEGASTSSL